MPGWDTERARLHALKKSAYRGENAWTGSTLQCFLLAENDFLYYASAFHHVVPATPMSHEEAQLSMQECWRGSKCKIDLGYFSCLHCRQFSKHNFCEHVSFYLIVPLTLLFMKKLTTPLFMQCVAVIIFENILEELPLKFQDSGIESHVTNVNVCEKYDKFGLPVPLNTPEKVRQKFKSRS
jgi:hypothetical protein